MHFSLSILSILLFASFAHAQSSTTPAIPTVSLSAPNASTALNLKKRGLVNILPEDNNEIWNADQCPLTWYYNYGSYPSYGIDTNKLEFVPMMWGDTATDQGFYSTVTGLLSSGMDIKYVLGFNEPDACSGGSSCVGAEAAAKLWKKEIEPLKAHSVKLGAPAVRPDGASWLQDFYSHCAGGCTTDFMPVHYYGDAEGLAGWIGFLRETYQNVSELWVTEFAYPSGPLEATESVFNESVAFLDQASYVTHFSYFGAFRTSEANSYVGPNVAMLNNAGNLTSIGVWYLNLPAKDIGLRIGSAALNFASFKWWHFLVFAASCAVLVIGLGV